MGIRSGRHRAGRGRQALDSSVKLSGEPMGVAPWRDAGSHQGLRASFSVTITQTSAWANAQSKTRERSPTSCMNLGTNPVYHDERWLTLDGHPDSRPASPVESQWEVLHPRGLYAMEGLFTESEADELVQRLQARGRSDNISAYDVTQTVLRLISQTWMYMCQVHQGLPKHESGIFRANFLKCEFRKSTTWDISRNYEIFPESWLQRMANLTGSDLANFEMTQASKYVPGDFYSEHFDDAPCDHLSDGSRVKSMDFQQLRVSMFNNVSCDAVQRRSGTILVYLTGESEHEGGATHFPRLGVRVHARKGRAIFFRPTHPDGSVDPMLLHAAEGLSHGVKYVVQQWIRHPSRGPNS